MAESQNYCKVMNGPCTPTKCWVEFCAKRERWAKEQLSRWAYDTSGDKPENKQTSNTEAH